MDTKDNSNANHTDYSKYSMDTHIIYGKNISSKWDYSHHVVSPLSSSTTFRLDSVERGAQGFISFANTPSMREDETPIYIYDRLGDPNKDLLEENLADIEKGEMAVTFSSGMAAISAALGILTRSGDEIIAHRTLYGCTISLMENWYPRYGIKINYTDITMPGNILPLITDNTRVVYFETPSNPSIELIDIAAVSKLIKEINEVRPDDKKIKVVVDNTFATPFCQRPLENGADFVLHSLTKGIGGFGTDMGGVVIGPKSYRDLLLLYRKDFGAVLNTKAAWSILTYGLPTLPIRMHQVMNTALRISEILNVHPKVEFVNYPGLPGSPFYKLARRQMQDFNGEFAPGGLIYFVLKGDSPEDAKAKSVKFMNYAAKNAYTMTLAVSLGHTRTLIEHPASMTHSVVPPDQLFEKGIHPGGIRLAIGLERAEDLIADLDKCLKQIE
jgi:cystathionine beta-lyase/cystathionine gamma-synthase